MNIDIIPPTPPHAGAVRRGDININIDTNTNIDIHIIINMNIEDYMRYYTLLMPY